jgi:hypothetical protein
MLNQAAFIVLTGTPMKGSFERKTMKRNSRAERKGMLKRISSKK